MNEETIVLRKGRSYTKRKLGFYFRDPDTGYIVENGALFSNTTVTINDRYGYDLPNPVSEVSVTPESDGWIGCAMTSENTANLGDYYKATFAFTYNSGSYYKDLWFHISNTEPFNPLTYDDLISRDSKLKTLAPDENYRWENEIKQAYMELSNILLNKKGLKPWRILNWSELKMPLLKLALSIIYRNMSTNPDDSYSSLAESYIEDFEEMISTQTIHYDDTMDGFANEPAKDLSNVSIERS
ncbi:MAG: hypothetical protein JW737_07200 [Acidobacteria bacterium]|nr:hypothetical protein [Acidobacteriota bacterium]